MAVASAPGRAPLLLLGAALLAALFALPQAHGQAIISDNAVRLGVQIGGDLTLDGPNTSDNCFANHETMRWIAAGADREAMDCDLEGEGWSVGYGGTGSPPASWYSSTVTGWAFSQCFPSCTNQVNNVAVQSFTTDTALSEVKTDAMVTDLEVRQHFHPVRGMPQAYANDISLTNRGTSTMTNLRYRRVMNWGSSVPLMNNAAAGETASDCTWVEFTRMPGAPPSSYAALFDSNTFKSANIDPTTQIDPSNTGLHGPPQQDIVSGMPGTGQTSWRLADQGGSWDFDFGNLPAGKTETFTLYYGGDVNYAAVTTDLGPGGLNVAVYDLSISLTDTSSPAAQDCGLSGTAADPKPGAGDPVTFFMAFGNITLYVDPPPLPPVASFTTNSYESCADSSIRFVDLSHAQEKRHLVRWLWDFGDATTSTLQSPPDKLYAAAGDYLVRLTVWDDQGRSGTIQKSVHYIGNPDCPPSLDPNPDMLVYENSNVIVCWIAHDDDDAQSALKWTVGGLPNGTVWDPVSHCYSWHPTESDLGPHPGLVVQVCDAHNCASREIEIDVVKAPPNPPPQDSDRDGISDDKDNCPSVPNHDQRDTNGDGVGDACDPTPCHSDRLMGMSPETNPAVITCTPNACPRLDAYGFTYWTAPCSSAAKPVGRVRAPDRDGDGVPDAQDNCPSLYNPDQADLDHDGIGDACDVDMDGDGINDKVAPGEDAAKAILDNCPSVPNPDQRDSLGDGVGDACRGAQTAVTAKAAGVAVSQPHPTAQTVPILVVAGSAVASLGMAGAVMLVVRRR
ncbi:MAG: thrombospondin type 3 repeat-containing protein [Thermoplasmatota archaeon]